MKLLKRKITASSAKKLTAIRTGLNYTRRQMAARLEITFSAYSKNEIGDSFPGWSTLLYLQEYYNISMDWFLFDRGPMYLKDKDNEAERIKELEDELLKCNGTKEEREKKLADELLKYNRAKEETEKELMNQRAEIDELKETLRTTREAAEKAAALPFPEGTEPELCEMVTAMNDDKRIRFKVLSYFYECKDKFSEETKE